MKSNATTGSAMLLVAATAIAQAPLALETQFGETVPILGDGQARIVVYADRDGSDQAAAWGERLKAFPCPEVAAANLAAVPDIARTMVRESFRDDDAIALDWHGKIADRLGFRPGEANVYLVDGNGTERAHFHGAASGGDLDRLDSRAQQHCATGH